MLAISASNVWILRRPILCSNHGRQHVGQRLPDHDDASERSSSETRIPNRGRRAEGGRSAGDNRSRAPSRGRVDRTAEPVEGNELGEGSAPSAETNNF